MVPLPCDNGPSIDFAKNAMKIIPQCILKGLGQSWYCCHNPMHHQGGNHGITSCSATQVCMRVYHSNCHKINKCHSNPNLLSLTTWNECFNWNNSAYPLNSSTRQITHLIVDVPCLMSVSLCLVMVDISNNMHHIQYRERLEESTNRV